MSSSFTNKELTEDDLNWETGRPNKSKLRREALAITELGRQLVEMSDEQRQQLPLSAQLQDAIQTARQIRKNSPGLKRQIQFIGKLIRQGNTEELLQTLAQQAQSHTLQQQRFHQLEQWRDRLIEEGDTAINRFIEAYPNAERQPLRQFIRQAQRQAEQNKPPAAKRELFKYLRECLEQA